MHGERALLQEGEHGGPLAGVIRQRLGERRELQRLARALETQLGAQLVLGARFDAWCRASGP